MSGERICLRDSVQAPLTLITTVRPPGELQDLRKVGPGSGGAGGTRGTRGCRMPRWSRMKRVSGGDCDRSVRRGVRLSQHRMLRGKS